MYARAQCKQASHCKELNGSKQLKIINTRDLSAKLSRANKAFVSAISSLVLLLVCSSALSADDITADQLLSMDKSERLLLDVRTVEEFTTAHIPTSVNIPLNEIESSLSRLSEFKDYPIVVYCRSGRRAGSAIAILEESGFTNVKHLSGDMNQWQAEQRTTNQLTQ